MALINEIIPLQGFNVVTKRVGAILLSEITNQIALQSLNDDFKVYLQRTVEYDKSEGVVINVSSNTASYSGQNQSGSQGDVSFTIDIYCSGNSSGSGINHKSGDADSSDRLDMYLGFCRYIMGHTKYKILDFPPGLVTRVYVNSWQKDNTMSKDQSDYIRMAQLVVSVVVAESQEMWETQPLSGNDTTIKLSDTDKGYRLIFNN